jgi:hypothetical protein
MELQGATGWAYLQALRLLLRHHLSRLDKM